VIPSANSLMLGQPYQLQIANDLNRWTNFSSAFFATNNAWTSTNYWIVTNTNPVFFRLEHLQCLAECRSWSSVMLPNDQN
jgi:hypothetical protein